MKCVVLAAGKGVRMSPLTLERPKSLIEVAGKPFLYFLMKNLERSNFKYEDIYTVVGYKGEMIRKFLEEMGFRAKLIEQNVPLGTGHAVMICERFIGKENFVVVNADNLYSTKDLKSIQRDDEFCYVVGKESENTKEYGILLERGDLLVKIKEKMKEERKGMINMGLYKLTPDVFGVLREIGMSPRGEFELTDAINLLCKRNKVKVMNPEGYWFDLRMENINEINSFLLKNKW
jgi:NDP-sugar pyrophosphorylase family protein